MTPVFRTAKQRVLSFIIVTGLALSFCQGFVWAVSVDDGDVPGLIAAINAANGGGDNTIDLAPDGTYTLTVANFANDTTAGTSGLPTITGTIVINGNGAVIQRDPALLFEQQLLDVFVDGRPCGIPGPFFRILHIAEGGDLTLNGVTVRNGCTLRSGNEQRGAGIFNQGKLVLNHTTVMNNESNNAGGGIANTGQLNVNDSTVRNNATLGGPGTGIFNENGVLILNRSTVHHNGAGGGAVVESWSVETEPGERNRAVATIVNSTISDNVGGGVVSSFFPLSAENTLILIHSTIVNNRDSRVAGLSAFSLGRVVAKNTIVANNSPQDCMISENLTTALGANIASDGSCGAFSNENTNPMIGPLQDNGGPAPTHALLPGSPALDAAVDCTTDTGSPVASDQRGIPRPQGANCDLGAFERADCDANRMVGTEDGDRLQGTDGSDLMLGGGGDDTLKGNGGDDCLFGGRGNDRLLGGSGNDIALGGYGDDKLFGNSGDDNLFGGPGEDRMRGGSGTDNAEGGQGEDKVKE